MKKEKEVKIKTENLSLFYGEKQALDEISLDILTQKVTALIYLLKNFEQNE